MPRPSPSGHRTLVPLLALLACGQDDRVAETASSMGTSAGSGASGDEASSGGSTSATSTTGTSTTGTSTTAGSTGTTTGATGATGSSGETSSEGGDGGPKLDVGGGMTGGATAEGGACDPATNPDCGCTAVDLLFIIDNSSSMGGDQASLAQAFPLFVDGMIGALPPGTNLHVGVTTTEMGYAGSGASNECGLVGAGPYDYYQTPDTMDSGKPGAQGRLWVEAGKAFYEIDTSAPPAEVDALKTWFSAAAQRGENGSNVEMSVAGAAWAMDPANAATNAGFVRDEGAVLVLFFITDEADQTPGAESAALIAKIAAAKQRCGGLNCVVGGGFILDACMTNLPLDDLFAQLPDPPTVGTLSFFGSTDPNMMADLLQNTLAQVIAKKCEEIPPPVG